VKPHFKKKIRQELIFFGLKIKKNGTY